MLVIVVVGGGGGGETGQPEVYLMYLYSYTRLCVRILSK